MGEQLREVTEEVTGPRVPRELRAGGSENTDQGQLELDQSWRRQVSARIKLRVGES